MRPLWESVLSIAHLDTLLFKEAGEARRHEVGAADLDTGCASDAERPRDPCSSDTEEVNRPFDRSLLARHLFHLS